ncbi:disease resistance protein RGA2-like isoform X3 [Salvia miltiorrhiza]|uniref:disease resistance protein RGA2-like isoform X3 n=1 Tax=Salvia miltiorrhiza TaxID=226208 RepID=UPI0025AC46B9|nr:disease resistance protein RGA2-like isoform X3 [Salvia miltiorrhiza]XP_057781456.1 disease resistance protein RGA2-like isoform X3 [Salvia miltiorrhiza]
MEGEAAAAVLQTLVQNVIDLCKKEISQIRDLDKNAAKLTTSLKTIQKFLNDAETRNITSEAVKDWLKNLEDVAFDADNVLDEINYNILSKQIKPAEPEEEKVPSCFPCFSCFKDISCSRNMALKIKEINENLESINKEAAELGLREKLANEPALVIAAVETAAYTLDPIFIGRDDAASKVVEMLTANSITIGEHAVSVISVVGMGGLGKTTLTRKVLNHLKNDNRFGSYIWVHVSPNFDPIILFKKILKEVSQNNKDILSKSDEVAVESKQDILSKLKIALEDKTYLLVLDDVWNEERSKWEDFINCLLGVSGVVKGNAIVVTTRNMNVASIVNPLHVHQLKGLSDEECWSIIRVKAFGKEDVPSELEATGRQIAKRCQGLPLAANVVGGVLHNKPKEKWCLIEEKWLSANEGGVDITNILRLSFDNLSPPLLKKCFAYCAMFPKGSKIVKQKLIEMWTAEGFLQADGSDDMGEKFINVLLHNSLLQVSERDYYGNVESCGMHDLVHDLACSVSSSSNNAGGSSRVRYMTLGDDNCGDISSRIPKEMAKSLRSLLISFKGDISDINFSDFESLHVLGLDSEVKELSSSIRKLIHLRYFDISKTRIVYLPSTIKYLINLRHLYINSWVDELPMGIGRLTSLQTLTHFPVGHKNGCKIEELGSLNNLKGELEIHNLERVHDKEEAGKANLFKKSKILKLCLTWNTYGRREGETNDEDVLEGLQPPSHLRELKIDGFNGKRFPLWTEKMSVRDAPQGSWVVLNKLMSLELWNCKECEEMPMLGQLPNLKSLVLYGMPKLAEWAEIEISDGSEVKLFPCLQHLYINDCPQLMSVPSHVSSCLETLTIDRIGVECLPADWLLSNSETLSSLVIWNCRNLREISDRWGEEESEGRSFTITSLPKFPRLKFLYIRGVPKLSLENVDAMQRLQIDGFKSIYP